MVIFGLSFYICAVGYAKWKGVVGEGYASLCELLAQSDYDVVLRLYYCVLVVKLGAEGGCGLLRLG